MLMRYLYVLGGMLLCPYLWFWYWWPGAIFLLSVFSGCVCEGVKSVAILGVERVCLLCSEGLLEAWLMWAAGSRGWLRRRLMVVTGMVWGVGFMGIFASMQFEVSYTIGRSDSWFGCMRFLAFRE